MKFLFIADDSFNLSYLCQNPVSHYTFAKILYCNLLNNYVVNVNSQSLSKEQVLFIYEKLKELEK